MTGSHRILFAGTSLQAGAGGIQRVGRMVAQVLAGIVPGRITGVTLCDSAPPVDSPFPVTTAGGSRFRFAWSAFTAGCTHLIADTSNIARIQFLPGLRGKPVLTLVYGIEMWETAKPRWVRSARAATVRVFISEYTRRRAEASHGAFGHSVLCAPATESDHPPPPTAGERRPEVLIVGRMAREEMHCKGHWELIEIWPAVVAAVPDAVLRIVGRGPLEAELRQRAAASPVAPSIVFEGFVPDNRLDDLYARATVFAMPSRGEGFGIVYAEAMRHALPVIASVHDAAPEVVLDGRTGFTVDLDQPGQLLDRLVALLRDPALAARMGEAGYRRWIENYRYSCFRDRLTPILRDFLTV